jgi:hypothetical protein
LQLLNGVTEGVTLGVTFGFGVAVVFGTATLGAGVVRGAGVLVSLGLSGVAEQPTNAKPITETPISNFFIVSQTPLPCQDAVDTIL